MQRSHDISFPNGMSIYIDMDLRNAVKSGDFVVATIGGGQAEFRQFVKDGRRTVLMPLNHPKYAIIEEPFEIVGRLIHAGWDFV